MEANKKPFTTAAMLLRLGVLTLCGCVVCLIAVVYAKEKQEHRATAAQENWQQLADGQNKTTKAPADSLPTAPPAAAEAVATAPLPEQEPVAAVPYRRPRVADDSTLFRILLTGDSMGDGIHAALMATRKINNCVIRYVPWYGSNTAMWGKVKKLENLIEEFRPRLVIFTLGSNELFVPGIRSREKYVQEIVRQMGGVNFVWVGPPNWKPDTGINDLIAKHAGDRFFISRDFVFERAKDGAHPTYKACEIWADTLTRWVNQRYQLDFVSPFEYKAMKRSKAQL